MITNSDDDYFLTVESHFAQRRGTPFIFSAKDWALLKSWRDDGVPLAVVLEAIDSCFDKQEKSGRKKVVSSLSYCRHAVKEIWNDRKEMQVGSDAAVPELDPAARLQELAAVLESAAGAGDDAPGLKLRAAADSVRSIAGRSVPAIEDELTRIEDQLVNGLIASLPGEEREAIERDLTAQLAPYGGKESVLAKTRAANLKRMIRKRFAIPRLSLFG